MKKLKFRVAGSAALTGVLFYVLVGGFLTCPSRAQGQPQNAKKPAPREAQILNHFRKDLGKGLKIFFSTTTTFGIKDEEDYVIAVTKDNNDERPKLRIFEHTVKGFMERFVAHPGDSFETLHLDDLTNDGRQEIVTLWNSGQLKMLTVITYSKDQTLSEIFSNGGREITIRPAADGTKEIVIKNRTYAEKEGEPWTLATAVYRWNGSEFAEVVDKQK
jgi:hypothetical protein